MAVFDRTHPDGAELFPAPLPPAAILAGDPQPRSTCLTRPPGDGLSVGLWECGRGAFRMAYKTDETITILEGSVRVTDVHGTTTVLREGDWATFTSGDVVVWEIDDHVRKVWVCTAANHLHSRVLLRARTLNRRLATRFGRTRTQAAAVGGSAAGVAGIVAVLPL